MSDKSVFEDIEGDCQTCGYSDLFTIVRNLPWKYKKSGYEAKLPRETKVRIEAGYGDWGEIKYELSVESHGAIQFGLFGSGDDEEFKEFFEFVQRKVYFGPNYFNELNALEEWLQTEKNSFKDRREAATENE